MNLIKTIKNNFRERRSQFILLIATAIIIAACGIIFKTPALRILPLFVSLFVMLYQSEANRYAYLLGAANCLLYAIAYYSLGVYASAASSLFFSLPVSVITFISWNKRSYKKTVVFKKMSTGVICITAAASILVWIALFFIFDPLDSEYAILDNAVFVSSTLSTILTLFAYKEYSIVGTAHIFLVLLLNIQMALTDVSNLPFLIYTCYNLICHARIIFNVRRYYKEQNPTEAEAERISEEITTDK